VCGRERTKCSPQQRVCDSEAFSFAEAFITSADTVCADQDRFSSWDTWAHDPHTRFRERPGDSGRVVGNPYLIG
jgi:hypothetical protein